MSDTLVIHLQDASTEFLKFVYEGAGYDVINNGNMPDEELRQQLEAHDRIIMLGHGMPYGLINVNRGDKNKSMAFINSTHADILRDKETISMWCYSDRFFRPNNLHGFHTGMIISEVSEAEMVIPQQFKAYCEEHFGKIHPEYNFGKGGRGWYRYAYIDEYEDEEISNKEYIDYALNYSNAKEYILENNINMAKIFGEAVKGRYSAEQIREHMLKNYVGDDPVTQFNRSNMIVC